MPTCSASSSDFREKGFSCAFEMTIPFHLSLQRHYDMGRIYNFNPSYRLEKVENLQGPYCQVGTVQGIRSLSLGLYQNHTMKSSFIPLIPKSFFQNQGTWRIESQVSDKMEPVNSLCGSGGNQHNRPPTPLNNRAAPHRPNHDFTFMNSCYIQPKDQVLRSTSPITVIRGRVSMMY